MRHLEAVWRFEEEIGGELNLNVTTFQHRDVLTSRRPNIVTLRSYDV